LKIAVYTISKNEEKHVERWYDSCREADFILLADTGSTDKTIGIATGLGIKVVRIGVSPFRFDDARNASLALVPTDVDYCIALDVDEVLAPGWREALEKAHEAGIDRPIYRRIESFNADGSAATEFNGFKVHRRNGIRWHYPIHEVPHWYSTEVEKQEFIEDFEIHHHQDRTKSRGQYLPLLEMAVKENPDARNLYYLGREQSYYKQWDECAKNLKQYLEKSIFPQERSAACRILGQAEPKNAEDWFMQGTKEWPCRESYLALANYYYLEQDWDACHLVAKEALQFDTKPMEFLAEAWAWGHMANDLVAVSAWQLGDYKKALEHGEKALAISPNDERLKSNVTFYRSKIDGNIQSADQRGSN